MLLDVTLTIVGRTLTGLCTIPATSFPLTILLLPILLPIVKFFSVTFLSSPPPPPPPPPPAPAPASAPPPPLHSPLPTTTCHPSFFPPSHHNLSPFLLPSPPPPVTPFLSLFDGLPPSRTNANNTHIVTLESVALKYRY